MPINKYIKFCGIETEGFFFDIKGSQGMEAIRDVSITHDGSVKHDGKFPKKLWELCKADGRYSSPAQAMHVGEVVSQPFDNLEKAKAWMLKYYPAQTNAKCGLHFHISLNDPSYYSCLMEKEFYLYLKESLAKFADEEKLNRIFRERFNGTTEWAKKYCRDEFIPLKQAFVTQKNYNDPGRCRYTLLNFCFSQHETMEIRVFTAHMPSKRAVNCLQWYVDVVTSFLEQNYDKLSNSELTKEDLTVEVEDSDLKVVAKVEDDPDNLIVEEFSLDEELTV